MSAAEIIEQINRLLNDEQMYDHMIGIAEKRYSKADLADYFRRCSSGK